MNPSRRFKDWAIPGPEVPGEQDTALRAVGPDETLDGLSGHFKLFQLKAGHRFSTDDLLVAWFGTTYATSARTVLDLGSGIGTVGMIAAWRLPAARFVTVEAQAESVALARRSARYNGIAERYEIRQGDFRGEALRPDERFDLILGSPPYFPLDSGLHGDHPQKIACRFEVRGNVADYCAVAARHLNPSGTFSFVFPIDPPHQRDRARAGIEAAGLRLLRFRPVALKEGETPLLGLFQCIRREDLPESARASDPWVTDAPLIIRQRDGSIHPEYSLAKLSIGFHPL